MFRKTLIALSFMGFAGSAYAQPVDQRNPIFPMKGIVVGPDTCTNLGPGTINVCTNGGGAPTIAINGTPLAGGAAIPTAPLLGGANSAFAGITLGTNLSLSGNVLNATGGASPGGTTGQVQINNGSGGLGALPTGTTGASVILQTTSGGVVAPTVLPIATTSAPGAIVPDGTTITTNPTTGVTSVIGGAATSVTAGTTSVGGAAPGTLLYNNAGVLGSVTPTGSGNVVLATSPTISAPVISGGTSDNHVIGSVTPAAATFTSLAATGATTTHGIVDSSAISTTGVMTSTGITQGGSGVVNFSYGLNGTPANLHLFRDGAGGIDLKIGGTVPQVIPTVPMVFSPSVTALSGTWALSANPDIAQNTVWTGTISAASLGFFTNAMQHTFNVTTPAGTQDGVLYLSGTVGQNENSNLYVLNATASLPAGLPTPPLVAEIHAATLTGTGNGNMGGVSTSQPAGIIIGAKVTANTGSGATFLSQTIPLEIQSANVASPNYNYGINIIGGDTVQSVFDDDGVVIWANSSNVGWKTGIMFGAAGGGTFGNVAGGGTFIGTNSVGGTPQSAINGIDFSHATFSGNSWNDGHVTISGTGVLSGTTGINDTGGINTTAASGAYKIGGNTVFNVLGAPGANTSLIAGSNAGALVAANNVGFVTFIGDSVGQKYVGTGGGNEVFCAGSLSCGNLTTGGHDVGLGIGALWWETTGGTDTCVGSDTCRDTQGVSGLTAVGQGAMGDAFGTDSSAFGQSALAGNSAAMLISGTLATGDVLSGSLVLTGAPGSPFAWTYTVQAGDSIATLANAICSASSAFGTINGLPAGSFRCFGESVMLGAANTAVVTLGFSGTASSGTIITLTAATTGAEAVVVKGGATGTFNTAIGFQAMQGRFMTTAGANVAVGQNALQNIDTASFNACGGYQSCQFLTTGIHNSAWGFEAGLAMTTGHDNSMLGYETGLALTTGQDDILIGERAGLSLTSGIQNTLIGRQAGQLMTVNGNSTCVGDNACLAVAAGSNNGNTALGQSAGSTITTGHFNLILGPNVVSSGGLSSGSNNVVIGTTNACDTPSPTTVSTVVICGAAGSVLTIGGTVAPATSVATFAGALNVGANLLATATAPTINIGFGTGASVSAGTSSIAFQVNVGTGGTASTGTMLFPTAAPHGWACQVVDNTSPAASNTVATSVSTTGVVLTNYARTTGTVTAWAANDVLTVGPCVGY